MPAKHRKWATPLFIEGEIPKGVALAQHRRQRETPCYPIAGEGMECVACAKAIRDKAAGAKSK